MAGIAGDAISIGGMQIDALSQEAWAELLVDDYRANRDRSARPRFMTSANGFVLSLQARDGEFKRLLEQADGIDADGMSLVMASRWLGPRALPERVATTDLFHVAARDAAAAGTAFFLLGGEGRENRAAAERV